MYNTHTTGDTHTGDTATGNLREFLTNVLQINGWMLEAQQVPLKVPHPRKLCLDFLPHIRGVPPVHDTGATTLAQPPPATHTYPRRHNTGTATTGDIPTYTRCHNNTLRIITCLYHTHHLRHYTADAVPPYYALRLMRPSQITCYA